MLGLVENYLKNITRNDINSFAQKNQINLSDQELDFTYNFVKNNYREVLSNPDSFDFNLYKNNYKEENFNKIKSLIEIYSKYL